jgi:uroporphyrinogen-III synthase
MTPLKKPLSGRRVAVTRTREQGSELAGRLAGLGAEVVELPVIAISKEVSKELLADVLLELGGYDWLVFTSGNGVRYFFEEFFRIFDDIRSLGLIRIAAVGEGTARGLAELHLRVECAPAKATAEALGDALAATGSLDNAKVLVIAGSLSRDTLVKKLEDARAIVDRLQVYKTEKTDLSDDPGAADYRSSGADAVLFASSSAAQSFHDQAAALALGPGARRPIFGSIGPQTSATLKALGMKVGFEAKEPGFDGLLAALVKRIGNG